ncbi:hypothetical protein X735_31480 [Mesorhizobium sp. L2C085B000]|uniref:toll/interleukin-1 receptor domain-containing protein n=1 Tax=Mesorhizobium sp. L2C085B000 TaxID=1287117 RepID=UPI0003CFE18E|nr:toll/interleukin-1 receptor domain-containing protein [Mesorhizobium sp. L2C085B000]ESZ06343.1 hypothetical protein X735_31480 [Mesorhizobium sp. L2C085B000]
MAAKVFLSLSHIDRDFVREVAKRLPRGLAYFYEESFDNGELLIAAMERAVADAAIFVLFASPATSKSPWVGFEIDQARLNDIQRANHRLLIFPTSLDARIEELPSWLRQHWVAKAGWSPSDVARYIAITLLEPNTGVSRGAVRIVGRGKSLDRFEQLIADHMQSRRKPPNVYVIAGFRGIGRRTFAAYFMRQSLAGAANLAFGPSLILSPQADLFDLYRALRAEQFPIPSPEEIEADYESFQAASQELQLAEINRQISHFTQLGQAVTFVSANGFFEDRGQPKEWVAAFMDSLPSEATVFLISNRQFQPDFIEQRSAAIQMRLEELDDKDIKALMVFTADRLRVEEFDVSSQIVSAIGGHADVANAAVRLVAVKGKHILDRDPRQLFNVQNTILGENIEGDALSAIQRRILSILGWVPRLRADLLEEVLNAYEVTDTTSDGLVGAMENLVLGCLVIAVGNSYSISPAIRQLFRRWNVTDPLLLDRFGAILKREWERAAAAQRFDAELFESFVFMHALEGKSLPPELRGLLSPGMLHDVIRETYARGKDADDSDDLSLVVSWGAIAHDMRMSEATREEILSNVARAHVRLGQHKQAEELIAKMAERGYRSALFLKGHSLRRQERYSQAVSLLRQAVAERKNNRAAVHELALAYKKSGQTEPLRLLLQEYGNLLNDSAMFADFQIGIDLARGDIAAAERGITNLQRLPDDEGRSDVRRAQVLIRRQQYRSAKALLTNLLEGQVRNGFRIRSLRAFTAAKDRDFHLARRDVEFIKSIPGRGRAALRLEIGVLAEEGNVDDAQAKLNTLTEWTPEDWLLQARIWEVAAEKPSTGFGQRQSLILKTAEVRHQHRLSSELEYDD